MEKIKLVYIDNKLDLYVSKYLSNYQRNDIKYEYQEYKITIKDSYKSLLNNKDIESADILIVGSILFNNESVRDEKIFGEDLKLIYRKIYPFKETIIVTHYEENQDSSNLNKYNSNKDKGIKAEHFFEEHWNPEIEKVIDRIIHNRNVINLKMLENAVNKINKYFSDAGNGIMSFWEENNIYKESTDVTNIIK